MSWRMLQSQRCEKSCVTRCVMLHDVVCVIYGDIGPSQDVLTDLL